MNANRPDGVWDPLADSHSDRKRAERQPRTPQTAHPAYRLAYSDMDFLCREELRPVRLQLELLKAGMMLEEANVKSTVVMFGGARIPEPGGDPWAAHNETQAENLRAASVYYEEARNFARVVSEHSLKSGGSEFVICTGGGPGVMPPLPKEMLVTLLKNQWNQSPDTEDHHRRSINLFARRNLRYPIFDVFDRPDANTSCPERSRSTTAPQSLLMLNSQFSLTGACHLAGHVLSRAGSDVDGQITLCYQHALGRRPSDAELEDNRQFLIHQRKLLETEGRRHDQLALPVPCPEDADPLAAAALTDLCLAIFNLSEFVYVD